MNIEVLTPRLRSFLRRYKRFSKYWDLQPYLTDFQRIHREERSMIFMAPVFFLLLQDLIKDWDAFSWSWGAFYGWLVLGLILYFIYRVYWIWRAVDLFMESSAQNIDELIGMKEEQIGVPKPPPTSKFPDSLT